MMKKIFILGYILLVQLSHTSECSNEANCKVLINEETGILTGDLECFSLKENIANIKIKAYNVLDSNNSYSLKTYFGTGETVCDVLGWINKAADNLDNVDGLVTGYNKSIDLFMKHKDLTVGGGSYKDGRLTLDSDPLLALENDIFFDEPGYTDGNVFANIMKYQVVHEFFHYTQERAQIPYVDSPWVLEGTARMFEDIVYDNENPYTHGAYRRMYGINGHSIVHILENIRDLDNRYRSFAFWKLM